ncbi:MAG: NMD3-related protein, partial [Candidatus Aenigmatarchaeota archaeon]
MKDRFCPACGKKTDELVEGLCLECYRERRGFLETPDTI